MSESVADTSLSEIAERQAGYSSALSHESALLLHGLTDLLPAEIRLTVPRTASRRLLGVRLQTTRLEPQEVTWRQGLPVTALPRTIADLIRSGLAQEWIRQAVQQALARGLVREAALKEEADGRGTWIAAGIRAALEDHHAL